MSERNEKVSPQGLFDEKISPQGLFEEKIVYTISIGTNEILSYNLDELNRLLKELEDSFLISVKDHVLIKDIFKEEYISYKNELGITVKGIVKNYVIQNDLLEYIIRLGFLNKSRDRFKDIFLPFYTKTIKVQKYLLDDITFKMEVSMDIQNPRKDVEV